MDLQQDLVCIRHFANSSFPWPKRTTRQSYHGEPRLAKPGIVLGCKHSNLQVRPLSLLSHKPVTLDNNTGIKIYSPSITKHAFFLRSQDHDQNACLICCDIRAASDKTFLVPMHFENSGCRSQPPGVRSAICKQVFPAGRARNAAIVSFISEYSAEPGHTKPAAVDDCKHLNLQVRPLSLLSQF